MNTTLRLLVQLLSLTFDRVFPCRGIKFYMLKRLWEKPGGLSWFLFSGTNDIPVFCSWVHVWSLKRYGNSSVTCRGPMNIWKDLCIMKTLRQCQIPLLFYCSSCEWKGRGAGLINRDASGKWGGCNLWQAQYSLWMFFDENADSTRIMNVCQNYVQLH